MTDKYKVQVCRLFRGHPVPVKPAECFSVGHLTSFRALVRKAKQVAGLNNIKCVTEDRGDKIIIITENRTHQLEVQYCQA